MGTAAGDSSWPCGAGAAQRTAAVLSTVYEPAFRQSMHARAGVRERDQSRLSHTRIRVRDRQAQPESDHCAGPDAYRLRHATPG